MKTKLTTVEKLKTPEIEKFSVTVILRRRRWWFRDSKDSFKDVVRFGPIPNSDLFSITMADGETVVYPLTQNVRKYIFKKTL
jgi:hypothetical protein